MLLDVKLSFDAFAILQPTFKVTTVTAITGHADCDLTSHFIKKHECHAFYLDHTQIVLMTMLLL